MQIGVKFDLILINFVLHVIQQIIPAKAIYVDPDPHKQSERSDPDQHDVHADPQHWRAPHNVRKLAKEHCVRVKITI